MFCSENNIDLDSTSAVMFLPLPHVPAPRRTAGAVVPRAMCRACPARWTASLLHRNRNTACATNMAVLQNSVARTLPPGRGCFRRPPPSRCCWG